MTTRVIRSYSRLGSSVAAAVVRNDRTRVYIAAGVRGRTKKTQRFNPADYSGNLPNQQAREAAFAWAQAWVDER